MALGASAQAYAAGLITTGIPTTNVVIYSLSGNAGANQTGSLGGRTGADALCAASTAKPTGFAQYRAFISVSSTDTLQNMPTLYSLPASSPVIGNWDNTNTPPTTTTPIASSWTALLSGSALSNTMQVATGATGVGYWTGSNADGSLNTTNGNCNGWTTSATGSGEVGTHNTTGSPGWIASGVSACTSSFNVLCVAFGAPTPPPTSAPIDLNVSKTPETFATEIEAK